MRYSEAPSRRAELERILTTEGYVSSATASQWLGVSEMTIRRDLVQLETAGVARRVAGGAAVGGAGAGAIPFERRDAVGAAQKRAIAAVAADLIADVDIVAFDAGTTVAAVAPLLRNQTVVTHSLPVIAALASRRDGVLIAAGGHYQAETRSFAGPLAESSMTSVRTAALLLSATAVTSRAVWGANLLDASMKRILVDQTERVILLADGAKLSAAASLRIVDSSAIDVLVTDDAADPRVRAALAERGVRIVVAR